MIVFALAVCCGAPTTAADDGQSELLIRYEKGQGESASAAAAATETPTTETPLRAFPSNTLRRSPVESQPAVKLVEHQAPPSDLSLEYEPTGGDATLPEARPLPQANPFSEGSRPTEAPPITAPAPLPTFPSGGALRLAPPSSASRASGPPTRANHTAALFDYAKSKFSSLSTVGTSLAIVIGLFLAATWLLKGGKPRPNGILPSEAFAVLGRAPLAGQSIAHLLRLGNKLILVAVTQDGAQTLAEVTDPMEVDRIAGLCAGKHVHSSTAEFQQVLAQLSREPARGFLGREASAGRRKG